jgi:Xaa-Pro aminopeptidase
MPGPHAARRERLRAALATSGAEAVLVTRLVNLRYLTGFSGSNGALLLTPEEVWLSTDGRYTEQAEAEAPDIERERSVSCGPSLVARAAAGGVRRLAYEAHEVTVEELGVLAVAGEGLELVALGHVVEELRTVKDDGEVELLRAACAVGDRALADLLPLVRPGLTERQVAGLLEGLMRDHGSEGLSFETIAATGAHSAIPHHTPTDAVVRAGDLLKLDFGAVVGGYHSDMTRTFLVATAPAAWQQEVYDVVRAAQQAGRDAAVSGVGTSSVDRAARSVIEAAGLGDRFVHGLGHGVGLEIHEAPMLGASAAGILRAGTPVTVEPGIYLPGRGGVRIEDTLVVRDGVPDLLTQSPRQLLVLG